MQLRTFISLYTLFYITIHMHNLRDIFTYVLRDIQYWYIQSPSRDTFNWHSFYICFAILCYGMLCFYIICYSTLCYALCCAILYILRNNAKLAIYILGYKIEIKYIFFKSLLHYENYQKVMNKCTCLV